MKSILQLLDRVRDTRKKADADIALSVAYQYQVQGLISVEVYHHTVNHIIELMYGYLDENGNEISTDDLN